MSEKITSRKIVELLRLHRHSDARGEWATFAEVRNGTGYDRQTRYMDLFAINCWPSKKFRAVAYEVKVDRSDFMREILDPSKREFAEKVACETWFATPAGLVQKDEVPEGWGLVTVDANGGMKTVKMPMQREPKPWPMSFIASLLRKAADPASEIPEALWKMAGMELTEKDLIGAMGEALDRAKVSLRREVYTEVRNDHREEIENAHRRANELQGFRSEVMLALGYSRFDRVTDEEIVAKVAAGVPPRLLDNLRGAHAAIGKILESVEEEKTKNPS